MSDAQSSGTVKVCKRCGKEVAEYAVGWRCVTCVSEVRREYYYRHHARIRDWYKQSYKKNGAKIRAAVSDYQRRNSAKRKAYNKAYNEANRERLSEYKKQYVEKNRDAYVAWYTARNQRNREKSRAYGAEWRKNNRERHNARQREYYRTHPLVNRAGRSRRRARIRNLAADFTPADMKHGLAYWGHSCAVCSQAFDLVHQVHWDHWVSVSTRGCPGTIPTNMLPLCEGCNLSKNKYEPTAWLTRHLSPAKAKKVAKRITEYFAQCRVVSA